MAEVMAPTKRAEAAGSATTAPNEFVVNAFVLALGSPDFQKK
jgi:hypothetical protein